MPKTGRRRIVEFAPGLNRLPTFEKGDRVQWVSRKGGRSTQLLLRIGTVVDVISIGCRPEVFWPSIGSDVGSPRDHVSYVVRVDSSRKLYWPKVVDLEKFEESLAR